jgi:hypothetical protein
MLERLPDVLALFEKNLADFQSRLSGRSDEHLFQTWELKRGGPLTAYFRENDVPLPALHGPSADEPT